MICASCQTQNPDGAKFCFNCGARFPPACTSCGTALPEGARFCFNCGQPVAVASEAAASPPAAPAAPAAPTPAAPAVPPAPASTATDSLQRFIPPELLSKLETARADRAMEGERRIVTMLFCDLKGSTAAASQLDPEEWAEIMNGAFAYMIKPVYTYEGTIARLMGDAILAFFGAPIAHEDDPERAVKAGLAIVESIKPYRDQVRRQWDVDFDVRVGINTGLVVVGAVGSDLRMEYSALGDAINLAARMEQLAVPGTVQIAADTYRLVAPLFEVEDLGALEVKGREELVKAYRVLGVKAQRGRLRGIVGLDSPLVGRDAEMHTLRGAIIALRQGRGQIISLMGEAGLGKSRLVAELRREPTPVKGGRVNLVWLEGRSLSYETATPYAPFVDIFTEHFKLQSNQPGNEQYASLKEQVETLLPGQSGQIAPFLAALLDLVPNGADADRIRFLEPPQLRGKIFEAVTLYLESLAQAQPLVIVLDDIHWIDSTSLELLLALLPLAERAAILFLTLFRPRRQEPSWRFHETAGRDHAHRYQAVALQPLDDSSSDELVANLLRGDRLPEVVRHLILSKAEGNPFYVEEVIRALLDIGALVPDGDHFRVAGDVADIAVPDTLAAVITTRLDRLDEEAKQIVQTAAVIGREFQYEVLHAVHQRALDITTVMEATLTDLQRRELLREKARLPRRLYFFKHALTQETAYNSLLLRTRRELHRRIADCLVEFEPERAGEIARHYSEARDYEKALPYLLEAADRANRAYATAEATGFYRQALNFLERVDSPELRQRAYEGLGNALTYAHQIPDAVAVYQEMRDHGESQGDTGMVVSALNKLALVSALNLGRFDQANDYLTEADVIARSNENKAGISELALVRCMMCTVAADFEGVVRYMDETVSLGRELGVKEQMAMGMEHIASSQIYMADFDAAWRTIQEGLTLTRELGDRLHEAGLLLFAGMYFMASGDLDKAVSTADLAAATADKIGATQTLIYATWLQGYLSGLVGDHERALARQQAAWAIAEPIAEFIPYAAVQPLGALGLAYINVDVEFLDEAVACHERVLTMMENPFAGLGGGTVYVDAGICALTAGKLELARDLLAKGLTETNMFRRLEKPRYLGGLALTALAMGDLETAQAQAQAAEETAQKFKLRHHVPWTLLVKGQVLAARGDEAGALASWQQAAAAARAMGMRPVLWGARRRAADLLRATGRLDEAQVETDAAAAVLDEMASLFSDETMRRRFREQALAIS